MDSHGNFFFNCTVGLKFFIIKCHKRETGEVFRDQTMLSLDRKEFGLYPKMNQKPLKDFGCGGRDMIWFVFPKLSLLAMQGGVRGLGRK